MSLINPSIPNLKNLADKFPRGDLYDLAQALVVERDQLNRRLNALFGSFLEIKQGEPPVIKARLRSLPGSVIDAGTIDGRILAGRLNKSAQTFSSDIVFSTTDYDTVAWTAGSIQFADGAKYAISSGNTGNMTALTFVYFDPAQSTTTLKVSTDYTKTIGENVALLANAEDAPSSDLEPFWVAYNSVNLNINQLSVNYLAALSAAMGDLTSGSITLTGAGSYFRMGATPPTSATVGTGLWIDYTGLYGLVSNTQVFSVTSSGAKFKSATSGARIEIATTGVGAFLLYGTDGGVAEFVMSGGASLDLTLNDGAGGGEMHVSTASVADVLIVGNSGVGTNKSFTSYIATGTAPVIVTSTTVCTNLNADLLDGSHASAFAPSSGANYSNWDSAYTQRLQWDGGSTNLVAATGRTSLGLGTLATQDGNAASDFGAPFNSGLYVATSSGGSPTTQLQVSAITIAGTTRYCIV